MNVDLNGVFTRINEVHSDLSAKFEALSQTVASEVGQCKTCRRMVLGNGQPSMEQRFAEQDVRVAKLETSHAIRTRIDWIILGAVASTVAALVSYVLPKLIHLL